MRIQSPSFPGKQGPGMEDVDIGKISQSNCFPALIPLWGPRHGVYAVVGADRGGKKTFSKGLVLQVAKFCVVTELLLETHPWGDPSFPGRITEAHAVAGSHPPKKAELVNVTIHCPDAFHHFVFHVAQGLLRVALGGLWLLFPTTCVGSQALAVLCKSHGTPKQKRPL